MRLPDHQRPAFTSSSIPSSSEALDSFATWWAQRALTLAASSCREPVISAPGFMRLRGHHPSESGWTISIGKVKAVDGAFHCRSSMHRVIDAPVTRTEPWPRLVKRCAGRPRAYKALRMNQFSLGRRSHIPLRPRVHSDTCSGDQHETPNRPLRQKENRVALRYMRAP